MRIPYSKNPAEVVKYFEFTPFHNASGVPKQPGASATYGLAQETGVPPELYSYNTYPPPLQGSMAQPEKPSHVE